MAVEISFRFKTESVLDYNLIKGNKTGIFQKSHIDSDLTNPSVILVFQDFGKSRETSRDAFISKNMVDIFSSVWAPSLKLLEVIAACKKKPDKTWLIKIRDILLIEFGLTHDKYLGNLLAEHIDSAHKRKDFVEEIYAMARIVSASENKEYEKLMSYISRYPKGLYSSAFKAPLLRSLLYVLSLMYITNQSDPIETAFNPSEVFLERADRSLGLISIDANELRHDIETFRKDMERFPDVALQFCMAYIGDYVRKPPSRDTTSRSSEPVRVLPQFFLDNFVHPIESDFSKIPTEEDRKRLLGPDGLFARFIADTDYLPNPTHIAAIASGFLTLVPWLDDYRTTHSLWLFYEALRHTRNPIASYSETSRDFVEQSTTIINDTVDTIVDTANRTIFRGGRSVFNPFRGGHPKLEFYRGKLKIFEKMSKGIKTPPLGNPLELEKWRTTRNDRLLTDVGVLQSILSDKFRNYEDLFVMLVGHPHIQDMNAYLPPYIKESMISMILFENNWIVLVVITNKSMPKRVLVFELVYPASRDVSYMGWRNDKVSTLVTKYDPEVTERVVVSRYDLIGSTASKIIEQYPLIFAIWITECLADGFTQTQISCFNSLTGGDRLTDYILSGYYSEAIQPFLK